jgi:uncharacterized membrane protein
MVAKLTSRKFLGMLVVLITCMLVAFKANQETIVSVTAVAGAVIDVIVYMFAEAMVDKAAVGMLSRENQAILDQMYSDMYEADSPTAEDVTPKAGG